MNTKKEVSKFAKIMTNYIDEQIKQSKLIHEASGLDEPDAEVDLQKNINKARGLPETTPLRGSAEISARSRYEANPIPEQLGFIRQESEHHKIVNHMILRQSIIQNYMNSKDEGGRGIIHEPIPLLIWGAPGIGKSQGVKAGAVECAKQVARKFKLNFVEITDPNSEEFDKPIEEIEKNYYFINWNITRENIQNKIMLGTKNRSIIAGTPVVTYKSGEKLSTKNLFIFFDVRIAGMADQDILGIPFRVDRTIQTKEGDLEQQQVLNVDRLPFLKLCTESQDLHGVIMWDEINQGSDNAQAALYSIILDRNVGGKQLAPGIGQFAAANSEFWSGGKLKPALFARFASCYLYLSPEEWVKTYEKTLVPVVKDFILHNPTVSFYITNTGWSKHYIPKAIARGAVPPEDDISGISKYVTESKGAWPTPRMLSRFNDFFKDLMRQQQEAPIEDREWTDEKTFDKAMLEAEHLLGEVWADHFRTYYRSNILVNWETMTKNKRYAAKIAMDPATKDIVTSILSDKIKEAYDLVAAPYEADKYRKLASDIMSVFVGISSSGTMDPISTAFSSARSAISGNTSGKKDDPTAVAISKRLGQLLMDGKNTNKSPEFQAEASKVIQRLSFVGTPDALPTGRAAAKFADTTVSQPPTALSTGEVEEKPEDENGLPPEIEDIDQIPSIRKKKGIPESFNNFKKLFEEAEAAFTPDSVEETPEAEAPSSRQAQTSTVLQIIDRISKRMDSELIGDMDTSEREAKSLDIINHSILDDIKLTKTQKQKLISLVKTAPSSVNALLLLKSFSSEKFIL